MAPRLLKKTLQLCVSLTLLSLTACEDTSKNLSAPVPGVLFTASPPNSLSFQEELQFLKKTGQLKTKERVTIENEIDKASSSFGIPKAVLWCLLFQESRFDSYKNAMERGTARGIGQFLETALREINTDTDHFFPDTSKLLSRAIDPLEMPINFSFNPGRSARNIERRNIRVIPEQKKNSYFHITTSINASAAYLNNRYRELEKTLVREGIPYHPDVLWIYAIAAYNKGTRSVNQLLSQQRRRFGEDHLLFLLNNPKSTFDLMTDDRALRKALRGRWTSKKVTVYAEEMKRNVASIKGCATKGEL